MLVQMHHYIGGLQTSFTSPHGNHTISAFIERTPNCEVSAAVMVDGECVYATSDPQYVAGGINPETLSSIIQHATGITVEYAEEVK